MDAIVFIAQIIDLGVVLKRNDIIPVRVEMIIEIEQSAGLSGSSRSARKSERGLLRAVEYMHAVERFIRIESV